MQEVSLLKRHFTIGMAGHIDHGKTTLTKALTGINTDRLKEEQERHISIELGFAPLFENENIEVSLVDVPGHENFIRQMIAGVAGIDFVILAIAADEGIMPQTKEHLAILSLLGIKKGFVVLTKIDQVDNELRELVLEDVTEALRDTFLEKAPLFQVDSVSQKGIPELKDALQTKLMSMSKTKTNMPFRLPVDHVFTVKGQGVVARGTLYNGEVIQGQHVKILPSNKKARVRQIQTHGSKVEVAQEGQRTAINLSGISLEDIARGDILVNDDFYAITDRIDIAFESLSRLSHPIKQRQLIKLHIGTNEVMGKIIFFDRNKIDKYEASEILCQLQLEEKIVVTRRDRFILRRPTPIETIGGGWVIDPLASKHRFGEKTIDELKLKQKGTIEDRMIALLNEKLLLTKEEILKHTPMDEQKFDDMSVNLLEIDKTYFTLDSILCQTKNRIITHIKYFHDAYPMQMGINKAELMTELKIHYPIILLEHALKSLEQENKIQINAQYISLFDVSPSLPRKWEKKLTHIEHQLIKQDAETDKWTDLIHSQNIPDDIQKEFYYYLTQTRRAFTFDDERLISHIAVDKLKHVLLEETKQQDFSLQSAKEALHLSRKNLVPFLELMDQLGYTVREGNIRTWVTEEP